MSTQKINPSFSEPLQLSKLFTLRSSECDLHQKLKWESFFQIMQEMAWDHAQVLGIGSQIHQEGYLWVLTGMEIGIHRMPSWRETIRVSTRPMGLQGLFALRDFEILDADNQLIINASSAWLILDQKTRRPIRLDRQFPDFPKDQGHLPTFPGVVSKHENKGEEGFESAGERTIRYSETDLYGHVNNASYVRFIQDAHMAAHQESFSKPFHFSIRYAGESFPGDLLQIMRNTEGHILGKKDKQMVFSAKISRR